MTEWLLKKLKDEEKWIPDMPEKEKGYEPISRVKCYSGNFL